MSLPKPLFALALLLAAVSALLWNAHRLDAGQLGSEHHVDLPVGAQPVGVVHAVEVDITPIRAISSSAQSSAGTLPVKTSLCLRHVAFEDLGTFEPILNERGYKVTYLEAGANDLTVIDPLEPDLLIVLGGPIGVYELDDYPFLKDEIALLEKRLAADLPTLGICLGCQLMVRALGASVYPSGRKEIGWAPLILTAAGKMSPLAELAAELTPVLHWHGDTFDLPQGAVHLAASAEFKHQAFAWGKHCLGLQFHAEVTRQGLERWLIGHTLEINTTPGLSVTQLRADTEKWSTTYEKQGTTFCLYVEKGIS